MPLLEVAFFIPEKQLIHNIHIIHIFEKINIKTAQENGYYTIQWNLDTLDYQGLTGEEMWNRIKKNLSAGSIILSHNGTKHTAESLDMLIQNIKNSGYEIAPVSDLIYPEGYYINENGTQIRNEDN